MSGITQEDREAAEPYLQDSEWHPSEIRSGAADAHWLIQFAACHRIQARNAALEEAAKVADGRAKHAERLMLGDETGVTDARVAFQMASELVATAIRTLTQDTPDMRATTPLGPDRAPARPQRPGHGR